MDSPPKKKKYSRSATGNNGRRGDEMQFLYYYLLLFNLFDISLSFPRRCLHVIVASCPALPALSCLSAVAFGNDKSILL